MFIRWDPNENTNDILRRRKPWRVLVTDLFNPNHSPGWIAAAFGVMAACPQHEFFVATDEAYLMRSWFQWVDKRARDGLEMFPHDEDSWRIHQMLNVSLRREYGVTGYRKGTKATGHESFDPRHQPWPLENVYLGVVVKNQASDGLIDELMRTPAHKRWIYYQPAGPVTLPWLGTVPRSIIGIDWVYVDKTYVRDVIDIKWIRDIVRDCGDRVPVFVNRLGHVTYDSEHLSGVWAPEDKRTPQKPDGAGGYMAKGTLKVFRHRTGADPDEWPENVRRRDMLRNP